MASSSLATAAAAKGKRSSGSVSGKPEGIPGARLVLPCLVALLVTLVLVTFPRLPLGTNDDSSWAAVLGYGHATGLQFGTDLVFTYGPLGYLATPYFCPQAPFARLFTDFALTTTIVAGVCLLAWRLTPVWRWLVLVLFTFMAANTDPRTELLLYVGLCTWGMLSLVESKWAPLYLGGLGLIAVFASLAKVSFLFVATFAVAILCIELFLRGKTRLSLIFPAGTLLAFLLAWIAAGQQLQHLAPFLQNALAISLGYEQAMTTVDFPVLTWSAVGMMVLVLIVVALAVLGDANLGGPHRRSRQALRLAWFGGLVFLLWKHGFMRAGRDHTEIFLGFVPTLAVALAATPVKSKIASAGCRIAALACCAVALFALQWLFDGAIRSCLMKPLEQLATHGGILLRPAQYWTHLREMQNAEYADAQLPRLRERIGQASVDVFGYNQAYAVFNHLNFHPRPVFQSYAAYTERLMRLNEQFYLSAAAPEYVLFRLNPIDERFPPLEDARLFRTLLLDYAPTDAEGPFLLLKARQHSQPQMELLREGSTRPGELIDLREWQDSGLWLSLDLRPTLMGQLRTFFYQAPKVQLGVWVPGSPRLKMARFRAPAPMLSAGFLANPLQLENQDVLDLYVGQRVARAVAYSIELPPGTQSLWQNSVHYKIYAIRSPLGRSAAPEMEGLLKYPGFEATPEKVVATATRVLPVGGKPALTLIGGGVLEFRIPSDAKFVKGTFGYAAAAYLLGGSTQGAEFRIEEQLADGSTQLLYFQTLKPLTNPDDRGMKPFEVACPGRGERHLFLRARPLSPANPARELTCWAEIGFE